MVAVSPHSYEDKGYYFQQLYRVVLRDGYLPNLCTAILSPTLSMPLTIASKFRHIQSTIIFKKLIHLPYLRVQDNTFFEDSKYYIWSCCFFCFLL